MVYNIQPSTWATFHALRYIIANNSCLCSFRITVYILIMGNSYIQCGVQIETPHDHQLYTQQIRML